MDRQDDLNALERHLGSLRPAPIAIDRDRLMYLAGRSAEGADSRGRMVSAASIAALMVLSIGLGVMLLSEHGRSIKLRREVAELRRPAEPARVELIVSASPPSPSSYLMLTQKAFEPDLAGAGTSEPMPSPRSGSSSREATLSPLSARRPSMTSDF